MDLDEGAVLKMIADAEDDVKIQALKVASAFTGKRWSGAEEAWALLDLSRQMVALEKELR